MNFVVRIHDKLGNLVPECETILYLTAAADDGDGGGDKCNSETCANYSNYHHQHTNSQFFKGRMPFA